MFFEDIPYLRFTLLYLTFPFLHYVVVSPPKHTQLYKQRISPSIDHVHINLHDRSYRHPRIATGSTPIFFPLTPYFYCLDKQERCIVLIVNRIATYNILNIISCTAYYWILFICLSTVIIHYYLCNNIIFTYYNCVSMP